MNNQSKIRLFLILLFLLGFLLRYVFTAIFPHPIVFDQAIYKGIAINMMRHPLIIDSYRLYGYPLIMSILFRIISPDNNIYWVIFQNLLDTCTGIFVYLLGMKLFNSSRIALFASLMYMINFYTIPFVGVFLSEILTTSVVCILFYLLSLSLHHRQNKMYTVLFVLILGFLPQLKPSFLFFTVILLFFYSNWMIEKNIQILTKIKTFILLFIFYSLPFLYNLVGNYINYSEVNFMSVDNSFVKELYISLFEDTPTYATQKEVNEIHLEYHTPVTSQGRRDMTRKYLLLTRDEIVKNPMKFIELRIKKLWYVWEKHNIFLYSDYSISKAVEYFYYCANLLLLFMSLIGIYVWNKTHAGRNNSMRRFMISIVFLFVYTTVVHAFSLADERYTIPLYPFVILFGSYGCLIILRHISLCLGCHRWV